jgi:DNA-binding HxlR family transcriptional regulator
MATFSNKLIKSFITILFNVTYVKAGNPATIAGMGSAGLCARFHKAVELIGRRWSGAIIQILRQRPSRYAELRAAIPDITDRMLSERLRELEDEAIVARTVIPETPVRVEYSLTSKGRALAPALDAIGHWAEKWVEADTAKPPAPAPEQRTRRVARTRRTETLVRARH